MSSKLTLFHTDGCHLCDEAQALLDDMGLAYQLVDICEQTVWLERYRIRIPVLTLGGSELGWPFDKDMVSAFLESVK
ncbi:glutaredoxin family protein [Paraferrimonas haliotis]|uniref:Thioredoxin family protein n=1 Tax=Paraferrimonas haliotis TaxID=2013866 RepID=A0AA37U1H1_9GAMM|nr:glutaredoxin family protein [Paraferrimonas haliotis]GLS84611.1 thioredoxin family protein [Paraferrimonas haliotis]